MNKWIAEFELEDGDTMPEHMDLEYKGVRIDFHCKPLKQEPTTKNDSPKYCDRNICLRNEYNNVGCEDCEVTKSQESTTKNDLAVDVPNNNVGDMDCISRAEAIKAIQKYGVGCLDADDFSPEQCERFVINKLNELPSTPQEPRKGEWLRMSDLSEQEDDRYKCSRCGSVIHYKNKMDLYTFNSWCGRCGSDNGR